jgi:hypothetical protein
VGAHLVHQPQAQRHLAGGGGAEHAEDSHNGLPEARAAGCGSVRREDAGGHGDHEPVFQAADLAHDNGRFGNLHSHGLRHALDVQRVDPLDGEAEQVPLRILARILADLGDGVEHRQARVRLVRVLDAKERVVEFDLGIPELLRLRREAEVRADVGNIACVRRIDQPDEGAHKQRGKRAAQSDQVNTASHGGAPFAGVASGRCDTVDQPSRSPPAGMYCAVPAPGLRQAPVVLSLTRARAT